MEKQKSGRKKADGFRWAERLRLPMSLLLILTVLALPACGAGQGREEPVPPTQTEAPAPEPTPEPTSEPTPEPTPFPEPELEADCPVTVDGNLLESGSFLHEGVRYVYLSEVAQALGVQTELGEEVESCAFPWRKSRVELQAGSSELRYRDESVPLEAPVLLCKGGEEMLLPVESFCDGIQIGLLYDEEYDHLYCTPAAGDWELPQGYNVPVMMYHGVGWGSKDANLFVNTDALEAQFVYLLENGYTPIWFSDLEHVEDYEKPVLLTFDDGWKNNYSNLLPLAEKYQVKVTVFAVGNYLAKVGGNHLDADEALEMAASGYVDFQSHTMSHRDLTTLRPERQEEELRESRLFLTRLFGKEPFVISYPIGGSTPAIQELASHYYRFGVKMVGRTAYNTSDDPMLVYRFFPEKKTSLGTYAKWLASAFPSEEQKG